MKTGCKSILWLCFVIIIYLTGVHAQDNSGTVSIYESGADSVNCMQNWAAYKGLYKYGNYKDALAPWRMVFNECPALDESVYIDGSKMFSSLAGKEKDPIIQGKLLDTLESIYRQRITYFGKESEILGRFAIEYLRYRHAKTSDLEKGYALLERSLKLENNDIQWLLASSYVKVSILLYNSKKLSLEKVVENYTFAAKILDVFILEKPNDTDIRNEKELLEKQFTSIKVSDCNKICSILSPIFEKEQSNLDVLKRIIKLLDYNNCIKTKLYEQVVFKLNQLEPSAQSAGYLASLYLKRGNREKGVEYLKQAIEKEKNANEKARYLTILGATFLTDTSNLELVRSYSLEALQCRKRWGAPYILIGKAYVAASETCGKNDFEKKAIIWAAVDKFEQAKCMDISCSEEADLLITNYSKLFPDKENTFFYGYNAGDNYRINCWINETTIVRF